MKKWVRKEATQRRSKPFYGRATIREDKLFMRFYVSKFPCFLGYFCKGINLVFLHADDNRRVWVRCGKMPFLEKEKKNKRNA
jgi:hypothetical protein